MKGAELLVKCLEAEGVEYIFGIPGEETADINEALDRSDKITFIPTRHEQGAAFIADGYGRASGRAGVCLATLGPGATNLVTGIADATLDRAPVVALTGQTRLNRMHKESHQYVDLVNILRPITKWNQRIYDPRMIPEAVRKAFRLAEQEKPGATHLELPEDVMGIPVEGQPLPRSCPPVVLPETSAIEKAALMLRQAQHPLILAGNGVLRCQASSLLAQLVKETHLAVCTTFMGKGALSAEDPHFLFTAGLRDRDYPRGFLGQVDLVLCLGYDLVEWAPQAWNPTGEKKVICADTEPAETDQYFRPEVELVGDLRLVLEGLRQSLAGWTCEWTPPPFGQMALEILRSKGVGNPSVPVKPLKALWDLYDLLSPEDILVSDVGAHKLWIARFFPVREPGTIFISNGYAAMGFAVPAAIGIKLAQKDRRVVVVTGDGGFWMSANELETAVRLGLDLTILVWTDGAYGVVEWHQQRRFGRTMGTRFRNPDLLLFAQALGATGFRVKEGAGADSHRQILEKALQTPGVTLVEVPIDYSENPKLGLRLSELL